MLDRKTVEALNSMAEDFEKETGKRDLLVSSGFRSYDEQLELYSSAVESKGIDYAKNHISQPGYSEYHTGLSFDMSVYTDNGAVIKLDESEEYSWILEPVSYTHLDVYKRQIYVLLRFFFLLLHSFLLCLSYVPLKKLPKK